MQELQKGDVVRLKSGGPRMTITDLGNYQGMAGDGPEKGAKCIWFDGKSQKEAVFDVAVLQRER